MLFPLSFSTPFTSTPTLPCNSKGLFEPQDFIFSEQAALAIKSRNCLLSDLVALLDMDEPRSAYPTSKESLEPCLSCHVSRPGDVADGFSILCLTSPVGIIMEKLPSVGLTTCSLETIDAVVPADDASSLGRAAIDAVEFVEDAVSVGADELQPPITGNKVRRIIALIVFMAITLAKNKSPSLTKAT